ncbi:MAG TPA: IS5/IS1182 family transposase, partial [Longimicrobiaceae bacterium]|nr:IS5/IS1182 family transposase [Longimicrobiaceae bacterium]
VERCINRLKDFRAVATRYDKRGYNYLAGVLVASIMLWL